MLNCQGSTLNDSLHTWTMRKGGNLEDQFLELNGYPDARQKIKLTQEMGITLEVDIARFDVEPDDTTAYHWEDSSGQKRKSELPPYYICDMEAARHNMRTYGFRSSEAYIKYIIGRSNPIILKTFETAYNYAAAFKVSFGLCYPVEIKLILSCNSERPRRGDFALLVSHSAY